MKRVRANICKTLMTILCAMLLSCNASRQITDESADRQSQPGVNRRGFDPLELPADREIIPVKYPRSGQIIGSDLEKIDDSIRADSVTVDVGGIPRAVDAVNSQAYRIQVFTSKLYGEARKELQIAEEIFDRPVFIDYEVPYFKVRVGSFAGRDDAEEYQQRVKAAGYRTAWVVIVNIAVKEAAPLYDDGYEDVYEDSSFDYEDADASDQ